MTIAAGTRVGPYVVDALLGAGGMGEVYRAHDTRLRRDVALKILPPASAADPERLARFQREAQVLASLDHPNIAAIYGLEESADITALVLQLVEGETLADRIARGAIAVGEALPIALQIAEALEAAHEKGIIHRDLKPANVKITPEGLVKVLDFGLAKFGETNQTIEPDRVSGVALATMSPTITTPAMMTGVGVILGTAAYMSPEQAKGRPADKRSDVWAFGCTLYELLTARRAFAGDDIAETLAAVIRAEPDWEALPPLPAPVLALIKRCLVKDRRERISDIAAALFVLREAAAGRQLTDAAGPTASPARSRLRRVASYLAVAALAGVVTSAVWWSFRTPAAPSPITRFAINLPDDERLVSTAHKIVAISRDGTKIAYQTSRGLHVRSLSESDETLIPTTGINLAFSPDGQWIAAVWVYDVNEATTPRRLTLDGRNRHPVWSGDGQSVIFQSDRESDLGLFRVRADGTTGTPERLTKPDSGTSHVPESSSPDGKVLLYSAVKGSDVTVQMLSLQDGKVRPFPGLASDRLPNATFSPDGARIAYSIRRTNERRNTLFFEPFPPTGAKHFVAGGDAQMPVWSRDGRELFFIDPSRSESGRVGFVRVAINTRQGFATSEPLLVKRMFEVTAPGINRPRTFDILPDGQFVGVPLDEAQRGNGAAPRLEVVLNWTEELKRLAPVP